MFLKNWHWPFILGLVRRQPKLQFFPKAIREGAQIFNTNREGEKALFKKFSPSTIHRLLRPNTWRRLGVLTLIALLALPAPFFRGTQATQEPPQYKIVINAFEDIKRNVSTKLLEVIEGWKIK